MLSAARVLCRGLCVAPHNAVAIPATVAPRLGFIQFVSPSVCRGLSQDAKSGFASRFTRRRAPTLKERAMAPATDTAFNLGRMAVAGGSVLGIGALCYYGLGLSNEPGAIERASFWPEIVRQRVKHTYLYFAGSAAIAVASAAACLRSPRAMYTAGVVGGLSAVACCAPSDKFLYMGGPLAIGMGVVFAASIGEFREPKSAGVPVKYQII
ncbi:hypothetical protein B566_EDAN000795 [Ephemera danica]|nr:hypothetical protein B566_EDAN000795 [Ephemera danica]